MSSVGTHINTYHDASQLVTVSVFSHRGGHAQAHWINKEIIVGKLVRIETSYPARFGLC